jgi:hypothetical protein
MKAISTHVEVLMNGKCQVMIDFVNVDGEGVSIFGYCGYCSKAHAEMLAKRDAELFKVTYAGVKEHY